MSTVDLWITDVCGSKMTERNYRRYTKLFEAFTNTNLDAIATEWQSVDSYSKEKQFTKTWNMNVKKFKVSLKQRVERKEICNSTVSTSLVAIKSFFKWLGTPVEIKISAIKPIYHNRDITREEISNIIAHTQKMRDKAIYSMMAQSGLRPVSIQKLRYGHLREDFEKNTIPCKIDVPSEITKGQYSSYCTFIGHETVQYLKQYFKLRFKDKEPQDEDLVFIKTRGKGKICTCSISITFSHIALKLGIAKDRGGKPKDIRLYCLRKWFRMKASEHEKVDRTYAHYWMGHSLNMQDNSYFTKDAEKHRAKYKLAMEHLRINNKQQFSSETVKQELAKLDFGNMFKDWLLTTEGKQAMIETFKDTIPVELYPIIKEKLKE